MRQETAGVNAALIAQSNSSKSYIDSMAALVPAEVLALHAAITALAIKTENGTTTITDPTTLRWAFYALIILSVVFYIAGRRITAQIDKRPDRSDWVRMAIPPLAFIAWMMLQKATAFDAVAPGLGDVPRYTTALLIAAILGLVAANLAKKTS
jgi:hypothetical protein